MGLAICPYPRKLEQELTFGGIIMSKYSYEFMKKLVTEYFNGEAEYEYFYKIV